MQRRVARIGGLLRGVISLFLFFVFVRPPLLGFRFSGTLGFTTLLLCPAMSTLVRVKLDQLDPLFCFNPSDHLQPVEIDCP